VRRCVVAVREIHDDSVARSYAAQPYELRALNRAIARIDLGIGEGQIQDGTNGPMAIFSDFYCDDQYNLKIVVLLLSNKPVHPLSLYRASLAPDEIGGIHSIQGPIGDSLPHPH